MEHRMSALVLDGLMEFFRNHGDSLSAVEWWQVIWRLFNTSVRWNPFDCLSQLKTKKLSQSNAFPSCCPLCYVTRHILKERLEIIIAVFLMPSLFQYILWYTIVLWGSECVRVCACVCVV